MITRYHADDPWEAESGDWVRYSDHAAEVERLRTDLVKIMETCEMVKRERDEARAEVERLRGLLGECASYDYGSSWSANLRRRVDAALRESENDEEPSGPDASGARNRGEGFGETPPGKSRGVGSYQPGQSGGGSSPTCPTCGTIGGHLIATPNFCRDPWHDEESDR